ncbi:alanine racemase C-terminal domain-containing protein [Microbacterium sp. gxy059]|uniref:alanine racemase C-terminal domain-containing protein n=1 Tax=Microbacterium sp. gxy059 TaxID=2957199 RepID=UPI003D983BB4
MSRAALDANLLSAASSGLAVDLRRDACGHGLATVARAALAAGIRDARADDVDVARVEGLGLRATQGRAIPLDAVFGLAGAGAPVMTLAAPVLQTKLLAVGDGVSYGYLHRAERDTAVALVSGGYAQGVPRAIGGSASVLIGGAEHPVIGRVAMDVCVVDIGDAPVEPGDEAIFFGPEAPGLLDAWARATGWTPLELVAMAGLGAPREESA